MESVFYFTQQALTLQDIAVLANEAGYEAAFAVSPIGEELQVNSGTGSQWIWLAEDHRTEKLTDFSPEQQHRIAAYGPRSVFHIMLHPLTWTALRPLLQRLFTQHEGWISSDTDDLEPIFTAANIATEPYLPEEKTREYHRRLGIVRGFDSTH